MHVAERYAISRHTSTLRSDPRTSYSASDVIAAAGMAAQEHEHALLIWGIVYGGKTSQKLALVDALAKKLTGHMYRQQLDGDPHKITQAVLAHQLHAVCQSCSGTGYLMMQDRPIRGDEICPECDGTGKPKAPADDAFMWLWLYVDGLMAQAARKISDKLRPDR